MSDAVSVPEASPADRRRLSNRHWVVVAGAAVLYAYDVFEGLSNLVGFASSPYGPFLPLSVWLVLIASVIAPVLAFVAAFLVARRLGVGGAALVFLVGLCVSAVLSLTLDQLFVVLVIGSA